jgi:hypothetical protein
MMNAQGRKRVALVAAHFPPSNLAAVHRARLWSQYLPEFGWDPIVVTTHWRYYEERLDPDLETMLPPELRVVRTKAFGVRPIRIVGDIGVRAFLWHYRALAELARRRDVDFVHITIPSNFSAPLGRLIFRRYGIPYGIDYIDPWVHRWPGVEKVFSRAWGSYWLARWLEPWSVRDAALITGVAPGYFSGMLERNPRVAQNAETAAMPYGGSERDFDIVRSSPKPTFLFDPADGLFHFVYAGALLPAGIVVVQRFLAALAQLRESSPSVARRLRIHFVGTGRAPNDEQGHQVLPMARRAGVEDMVTERPDRIGYVDVLNHLTKASAMLVLGTTEPHYTPSKVFQAAMSRKPIFALLHEASTAVGIIRSARVGRVLTLTEQTMPSPAEIGREIERLVLGNEFDPCTVDWSVFDSYSARQSARALAEALDRARERRVAG